jgi:hypothetical protein
MTDASDADLSLQATVLDLAHALVRSEARREALARRHRWSIAGAVLVGALGLAAGAYLATPATAQTGGAAQPVLQLSQPTPGPSREQLIAMLPAEERARLEAFEQKVGWLGQYMRSSPQFEPGPAIALFLSQMAQDMGSVPKMHAEMQVMNGKMNALPVLANEVMAINAKLGVIAANMDSTMGRAGRMMPWGW